MQSGGQALSDAAFAERLDEVVELLEAGADIDARDRVCSIYLNGIVEKLSVAFGFLLRLFFCGGWVLWPYSCMECMSYGIVLLEVSYF